VENLPRHRCGPTLDHLLYFRGKQAFRQPLHPLPFQSWLGRSRPAPLLGGSHLTPGSRWSSRLQNDRLWGSGRLLRRIWHFHDWTSFGPGGSRRSYMKSCCPESSSGVWFIIVILRLVS
jgi:hypothetical protein